MEKIKVCVVNYLNSQPFIYGLQHASIMNEIDLQLDIPSVCADKLEDNQVDIGLVPVAILPELEEYHIISEYCIGADGEVGSVLLLSEVPLDEIETILLDPQSRTSVLLTQVLAGKFWNIKPVFEDAKEGYESRIAGKVAGVVIGDRTFEMKNKFSYAVDLSAEWKKYTQLPFVFACWVSNKELDRNFVRRFNEALRYGLMNLEAVEAEHRERTGSDVSDYLENKISYLFDDRKKFALDLFLKYENELLESDLMKIL